MANSRIKYIVADGFDVGFYGRKEDAENYMEAIDVRDGVYVGYDSEGRLLKISPHGQASEITLAEEDPGHSEDLRNLLIELLSRRGRKSERTDLESLLAMCEPYAQ